MANARASDDEYIPSLEKGLAVISLFSSKAPEWTLSEIARELQLTPGSTRRILRTLELLGYAMSHGGRFRLTARVLNLGYAYLSSQPFSEAARPLLRELATKLSINCIIAVLDQNEIVYIARETHRQFEHSFVHVGARFPAYATAPGKVLLAALPPAELKRRMKGVRFEAFTPNTVRTMDALQDALSVIREQGYAINNQEIFVGQRSLAVPLTIGGSETASIVAATSVSHLSVDEMIDKFYPALRAAGDEIQQVASSLL